jgi:hypothetical protein
MPNGHVHLGSSELPDLGERVLLNQFLFLHISNGLGHTLFQKVGQLFTDFLSIRKVKVFVPLWVKTEGVI